MRTAPDCIFCKIAGGSIPAKKVYEDAQCLAFHDISPAAPKHILLIPREHIARLDAAEESDAALLGHLLLVAGRIAKELKMADFRLVANAGASAGQSVFHLHFHILGDRTFAWPPG